MSPMVQFAAKIFAGMLISGAVYKAYIKVPQRLLYGSEPLAFPAFPQEALFLIFPGFGGVDKNIQYLEKEVQQSDAAYQANRLTYTYDWSKWRGNTVRAAFDSQVVGETVGRSLANHVLQRKKPLKELHVIGVSVGAFAADQCIKEYIAVMRESNATNFLKTRTRLTLLDPFTSRGVFGKGYGAKHFGADSDYCEHFVNTDDPVPFTNEPLPLAINYDVTNHEDRKFFTPLAGDTMHSWPVAFYGKFWRSRIDPRNTNPNFPTSFSSRFSRGIKIKL